MEWRRFLEENNIHFVDRGPNTKRGELSIHCPMCGEDDPSEHLGVNPVTGYWGCLRDQSHRGKSSRTLVKAILGCSSQQAQTIIRQYSHADPDSLESALAILEGDAFVDVAEKAVKQQSPEPEYEDFYYIKRHGITSRFYAYLQNRGYPEPNKLIDRYGLRCALTGRYKDRVIVPVRLNGELLGWTSRAIGKIRGDAPRYLASSPEIKSTVWNYDVLKKGGERLFIVEGPFDAIRLDNYGVELLHRSLRYYRATCTFGTSVVPSQYALLRNLAKKFEEVFVLFDRGAEGPAQTLSEWTGAKILHLPYWVEDPGELSPSQLHGLNSHNPQHHLNT